MQTLSKIFISEAHPQFPESASPYVRVHDYKSTMLIRPHHDFDALGLDFVLTYIDDPKAPFPSPAYKWLVKYGVPGYIRKVHAAALKLQLDHNNTSNMAS